MNHAQVDVDRRRVEAHRERTEESEVGHVSVEEGVLVPDEGVMFKWSVWRCHFFWGTHVQHADDVI